jgi:hypothetical protein
MGLLPGLSSGVVHLKAAEGVLGLKTTTPGMAPDTASDYYSYSFKSVKIAGVEAANPKLHVYWRPEEGCIYDRCWDERPAGYLSLSQFRAMHIYIAYHAKKMYLSAGDAKPSQAATSTASPAAH